MLLTFNSIYAARATNAGTQPRQQLSGIPRVVIAETLIRATSNIQGSGEQEGPTGTQIEIVIDEDTNRRRNRRCRDRDNYAIINFLDTEASKEHIAHAAAAEEEEERGERREERGERNPPPCVDVHSAGFGRANSSTVWHRSTPVGARFYRLEGPREREREREREGGREKKGER